MHGKIVMLVLKVISPPPKCDVQTAPVQLAFFSQVAVLETAAMMDLTELHIHTAGLSGMNADGMRVSEVADVN